MKKLIAIILATFAVGAMANTTAATTPAKKSEPVKVVKHHKGKAHHSAGHKADKKAAPAKK